MIVPRPTSKYSNKCRFQQFAMDLHVIDRLTHLYHLYMFLVLMCEWYMSQLVVRLSYCCSCSVSPCWATWSSSLRVEYVSSNRWATSLELVLLLIWLTIQILKICLWSYVISLSVIEGCVLHIEIAKEWVEINVSLFTALKPFFNNLKWQNIYLYHVCHTCRHNP